jgi:hypothetical protein
MEDIVQWFLVHTFDFSIPCWGNLEFSRNH